MSFVSVLRQKNKSRRNLAGSYIEGQALGLSKKQFSRRCTNYVTEKFWLEMKVCNQQKQHEAKPTEYTPVMAHSPIIESCLTG